MKVKVRVNLHGLFTVASASLTEKKEMTVEETPQENMDVDDKKENVPNGGEGQENAAPEQADTKNEEEQQPNKEEQNTEPPAENVSFCIFYHKSLSLTTFAFFY